MKSSLRPTTVDDLSVLRGFLGRAFGAGPRAPFLDPPFLAWKYWEPRGDWSRPRSYVLEKEGRIVAHAGLWPVSVGSGSGSIAGIQMIDWASAPESPGAGLVLVQKLAAMFDFIYSIGGSEMTRKVLPAFGFAEHLRQWRGARPLRPLRQILTHQTRDWKLAPRLLRNGMWAVRMAGGGNERWAVKEITPEKILPGNSRPPAFFDYLLRCPAAPFRLFGISEGDQPAGHFVMAVVRGQVRLAGAWLREPGSAAWGAAFSLARETALQMDGASELVVAGSGSAGREGAVRAGFQVVEGPVVYLLNKKNVLLPPELQFQLCDDDAAFLDTGAASYWT